MFGEYAATRQLIVEALQATDGDTYAAVEVCVDRDVAAGEYEGCSVELEIAAAEYEALAERVLGTLTAPDPAPETRSAIQQIADESGIDGEIAALDAAGGDYDLAERMLDGEAS